MNVSEFRGIGVSEKQREDLSTFLRHSGTPKSRYAALLILLLAAPAHGAGTTAAEFLRFGVGSAAAMGEAPGPIIQDATALYWNPAGLDSLASADVYASHNSLPLTLRQDFVALAVPLRVLPGVVGYSSQVLSQNPIEEIDNQGNTVGTYNATDMAHTVGWAGHWNALRFGASARYIRQSLAGVAGSAMAGNAGLQASFGGHWDAGASLSNVGSKLALGGESAPLPRTARASLGLRLLHDDLMFAGGLSQIQGIGFHGHVGAQMRLYPPRPVPDKPMTTGLFVRAGYTLGESKDSAVSGASWGVALAYRAFRSDFSYQPYGDLGTSLQFGLGFRF